MKNIFTIFSLTIFLSINAQTFKISEYDLPKIVSELFDAKYNRQTKEFIWKPNYAETGFGDLRTDGNLYTTSGGASDGNLYTKIDTILTHNKKKDIVTIATRTYLKYENGEIETCRQCSPILSLMSFKIDETRENLQLLYFKKNVVDNGSWGEPNPVEIIQFSENDYFVMLKYLESGHGDVNEYITLYYEGNEVLHFCSSSDNAGATYNVNKIYSWETSMKVDKINRIITLTKKGTDISEKTGKKIPVNKITKYKISDDPVSIVKI